jgi:hypothetical protein
MTEKWNCDKNVDCTSIFTPCVRESTTTSDDVAKVQHKFFHYLFLATTMC